MIMKANIISLLSVLLLFNTVISAQQSYELNSGWYGINVAKVKDPGEKLSTPAYKLSGWIPATVPGTVLTTLLNNKLVPDPFYGMNNNKIADIYFTGRDHYTYWFVKDFSEKVNKSGEQVWLDFRGINYSCDVFLNGKKLNKATHYGMFLRQSYNITNFLAKDGKNRLAVIVYPADVVGNPNGGQGGDGTIARGVAHQYTAGWDWIQPMRDRNTGIWDKVIVSKTIAVNLKNPHVITLVPGKRFPGQDQQPAIVKTSAEIDNPTETVVSGVLQFTMNGQVVKQTVTLKL